MLKHVDRVAGSARQPSVPALLTKQIGKHRLLDGDQEVLLGQEALDGRQELW
ncbi:MAG: hypothetical protein HYU88_00045 [Chloroflexi bacterium]|nr:hypothetical protein [Chloroflexota bacterium]